MVFSALREVPMTNFESRTLSTSGWLLGLCLAATAAWADFTPNESAVAPELSSIDPEYDQQQAQVTWVDERGRLWVADVDRETGLFLPPSGKGVLVDRDALTARDLKKKVGNGPEWLPAQGVNRIVYTKFLPGQPHTLDNARVAMAVRDATGAWTSRFLTDAPTFRPYSSQDPGDPKPRISYVDLDGNAYWRYADDDASQTPVPLMEAPRLLALRFVEGQQAVVYVARIAGRMQVVRHWLESGQIEQLTFDGEQETLMSPFMWPAPEFGGDPVLLTSAGDSTELRIYRQLDKSDPRWSVVRRIPAPAGTRFISAEPFIHAGRSYVTVAGIVAPNAYSSVIYLASVDPAQPLFRQLTPDLPLRARADPEVFVTSSGPYVYFFRTNKSRTSPCPCDEGVYRASTGLGAP
jgi:hypothetical protein